MRGDAWSKDGQCHRRMGSHIALNAEGTIAGMGALEGMPSALASSFAWQAALLSLLSPFDEKLQPGQKVLLFEACNFPSTIKTCSPFRHEGRALPWPRGIMRTRCLVRGGHELLLYVPRRLSPSFLSTLSPSTQAKTSQISWYSREREREIESAKRKERWGRI